MLVGNTELFSPTGKDGYSTCPCFFPPVLLSACLNFTQALVDAGGKYRVIQPYRDGWIQYLTLCFFPPVLLSACLNFTQALELFSPTGMDRYLQYLSLCFFPPVLHSACLNFTQALVDAGGKYTELFSLTEMDGYNTCPCFFPPVLLSACLNFTQALVDAGGKYTELFSPTEMDGYSTCPCFFQTSIAKCMS